MCCGIILHEQTRSPLIKYSLAAVIRRVPDGPGQPLSLRLPQPCARQKDADMSYMDYVLRMQCIYITKSGNLPLI